MAKRYEIRNIEYNQKMSGKYDGSFLHTISVDGGAKRKDFVFKNSNQHKVLVECAVGDIVELKIVKNGDFFNLAKDDDAITLVEKGTAKEPSSGGTSSGGAGSGFAGKSFGKDPEIQAAIIRQNGLTNATNLVVAMLEKGMFPSKVTADILVIETTRIAAEFAKFSSGELIVSEMTAGVDKPKPKGKASDDSDEFGA